MVRVIILDASWRKLPFTICIEKWLFCLGLNRYSLTYHSPSGKVASVSNGVNLRTMTYSNTDPNLVSVDLNHNIYFFIFIYKMIAINPQTLGNSNVTYWLYEFNGYAFTGCNSGIAGKNARSTGRINIYITLSARSLRRECKLIRYVRAKQRLTEPCLWRWHRGLLDDWLHWVQILWFQGCALWWHPHIRAWTVSGHWRLETSIRWLASGDGCDAGADVLVTHDRCKAYAMTETFSG